MGQKFGFSMPLPRLTDSEVQNGAPAKAEIGTIIAGRTRWAAEYISGDVISGQEPVAPFTSLGGGVGHDHSGGVMGLPLTWPLVWLHYGHVIDPALIQNGGLAPRQKVSGGETGRKLIDTSVDTLMIPGGRSHMMAEAKFGLYPDAAVGVLTEVYVNGAFASGQYTDFDAGDAGGTQTVTHSNYVALVPGRINTVTIKVVLDYTSADAIVSLLWFVLNQRRTSA